MGPTVALVLNYLRHTINSILTFTIVKGGFFLAPMINRS